MYEKEKEMAFTCLALASEKIMEIYQEGFHVILKEDHSPVTEADKAAESIIKEAIQKEFPEDGILSEESTEDKSRLQKSRVWIIDPLDGTKEFVRRSGQFATNLALAINGKLVAGFVASPVEKKIYYAIKGEGAYLLENGASKRIHVSSRKLGELIPICSNSKGNVREMSEFSLENVFKFAITGVKKLIKSSGDGSSEHSINSS